MARIQKRFDIKKENKKPRKILMPIEWFGSIPVVILARLKLRKHNMKGVKGPYLVLSNHASMVDFQTVITACFPHRLHWVVSIEEFVGREWLMRGIGGIPKRKFTTGTTLIRQMVTALQKNKKSVVVYPEARFSLAGITEDIGKALGKFVKLAKVPVLVLNQKGNFIRSPQWCKHPIRHIPLRADLTCVANKEEVLTLSADEIQERIEKAFVYDDYQYQYDNKIKIKTKKRAQNIHKILYKCPICGEEHYMRSENTMLWCDNCGAKWEMDVYGRLHSLTGEDKFNHVPDWYRWERDCVNKEVEDGTYYFEDKVRIEELYSAKIGFVNLGEVTMKQDLSGIYLNGKLDNGTEFNLFKPAESTASLHIEYNFKKRGDAMDINTLDSTWFVYPLNYDNIITKMHFATEAIYHKALRDKNIDK